VQNLNSGFQNILESVPKTELHWLSNKKNVNKLIEKGDEIKLNVPLDGQRPAYLTKVMPYTG